MIEQTYFLDMIPGESAAPVVHVSQFDVNSRTLTFNLMKGGVAYEPDVGMTVTLDGTKPDNTAFSYPMTVDGSSVSIALQPQMTVLSGHVRCEVTVSNASGQIGSANFILAVEESAIDTGAISDTDIPIFEDLKNQAQQAASEATAAAQTVSAILPENVGTVGQVLTRTGTGAAWDDVDGTWGSITGTLSDQTDLQNALNAKANVSALNAKSNTSTLATVESTSTASQAYAVGDYLVYNGILYKVISAIDSGETLTPNTNIEATTAGAELTSLNNGLTNVRTLNGMFGYKDRTVSNIAISSDNGYANLGDVYSNWGLPSGSYILGFYVRGWSSAPGTFSLASSSDGRSLYTYCAKAGTIGYLSIRVWYALF